MAAVKLSKKLIQYISVILALLNKNKEVIDENNNTEQFDRILFKAFFVLNAYNKICCLA